MKFLKRIKTANIIAIKNPSAASRLSEQQSDSNETNKKEKLKKKVLKLIDVSTVHGIPNIFRAERVLTKLIWLCATLASVVLTFYLIADSVSSYLEYNVITNIDTCNEQPIQFPTVSFCSANVDNQFKAILDKHFLPHCAFNDNPACYNHPEMFFEMYKDYEYGTCFRFNSGKNMSGHEIKILDNTLPGLSNGLQFKLNFQENLVVYIHNHSRTPDFSQQYNSDNEEIFLAKKYMHFFKVSKNFNSKMSQPYNDCYDDDDSFAQFPPNKTIINLMSNLKMSYYQEQCLRLCFNLFYSNEKPCNCSSSNLETVWLDCFVNAESVYTRNCTKDYRDSFFGAANVKKCYEYCPLECESMSYSITSSFGDFGDAKNGETQISLHVYFLNTEYSATSQQAKMYVYDLISNVGGTMGLFIGVSFLSFVELIEILVEILVVSCFDKYSSSDEI